MIHPRDPRVAALLRDSQEAIAASRRLVEASKESRAEAQQIIAETRDLIEDCRATFRRDRAFPHTSACRDRRPAPSRLARRT